MRPRLLDLFCGAGGAGMGYSRAGFEVVGVDIEPQKHYPFEFHQADAMTFPLEGFDVIHASPPCQAYSEATPMKYRQNHPDMIAPISERLRLNGKPYIIENVECARGLLINPIKLCGSMFGLPFWRHRYFETRPTLFCLLPPCNHEPTNIKVSIDDVERMVRVPVLVTGGGDGKRSGRKNPRPRQPVKEIRWAMGIDWMTQQELTEAIPPQYTHHIGRMLFDFMDYGNMDYREKQK